MSDQFRSEPFESRLAKISLRNPLLPAWLARRLLAPGEEITYVRGPRRSPGWERYVTHPVLALAAVGVGIVWFWIARGIESLTENPESGLATLAVFAAVGLVLATVFVLGLASGHFTRLVVTDRRMFIVQGREVFRSWGIDRLPASLIRYGLPGDERRSPTVDLDALQTMLGGSSDQFSNAKTILAFGKHLDRIKARGDDPTRPQQG